MRQQFIILLSIGVLVISAILVYIGIVSPYRDKLVQDTDIQNIKTAWEIDDFPQVVILSEEYLKSYPDNADVLVLKGFSHFNIAYLNLTNESSVDREMFWQSIHDIRKALLLSPSPFLKKAAFYVLGKNYYMLSGRYLTQSVKYLKTALDLGYQSEDIYEFLSSAELQRGNIGKAIEVLEESIKTTPKLPLYLSLIDIYLDQSDVDVSIDLIRQAKELSETEQEKLALLIRDARVEMERDNLNKASTLLSNIIEKYPQSVEAHFFLGNVYEKQGDLGKARYEWRQAYKMYPSWDKVIAKLDQDINL